MSPSEVEVVIVVDGEAMDVVTTMGKGSHMEKTGSPFSLYVMPKIIVFIFLRPFESS